MGHYFLDRQYLPRINNEHGGAAGSTGKHSSNSWIPGHEESLKIGARNVLFTKFKTFEY